MGDHSLSKKPLTIRERFHIAYRIALSLAVMLGIYLVVTTLFGVIAAKATSASVRQLGGNMMQTARMGDDRQTVELNGVRVEFEIATEDESVAAVISKFAAGCGDDRRIEDVSESGGVAACVAGFDLGLIKSPWSVFDQIGVKRLAYAERHGEVTRVVKLEAASPLSLGVMTPATGDAPGFDVDGVPRPEDARRRMSFRDGTGEYQSVFYGDIERSPADQLAWYRGQLEGRGWKIVDQGEQGGGLFLFASRGGAITMVMTDNGCDGTCSTVIAADPTAVRRLARSLAKPAP